MKHLSIMLLVLLCLASTAIVFIARIAVGPADLYEKDQPKTLAYTADILLHGRFALPRDVIYQPATKPPLYNWLAACVMKVTGSWNELAMKSPSVLGAIGVAVVLTIVSRRGPPTHTKEHHAPEACAAKGIAVAVLACVIWFSFGVDVRHGSVIRLMFLARPDMLQAFFLTGAWAVATLAFSRRATPASPPRFAVLFWLCITGAILTKGPLALLAIVYALLAARLITGDWRSIRTLRPITGSLAMLAIVGTWLFFAYRTDPAHVRSVMLGAEIIDRVTQQTPEGLAKPFWYSALWFVSKGGPFAILALLTLPVIAAHKQWLRPPDAVSLGAAIWLVVLLVGLSLPAGKRVDYLLPTFAPAAYLAARLLVSICRRASIPITLAGLLPLYLSAMLARANLNSFHEAREHWSDRAVIFARDVRDRVGDDESLLVLVRGKHPIMTLLHRHQGSALDLEQLRAARWIVLPLVDTMARPVAQSELVPFGFETLENRPQCVLGLFDMRSDDRPTLDELIKAQRAVATWTTDENPYRSPGTVWRE
jgi:4-amino-4-deoxy-L-arabinose transferase-like glycosyltransferase